MTNFDHTRSDGGTSPESASRHGAWSADPLREAERPRVSQQEGPHQGGSGTRLVLIHDHLRQEMGQLREVVARVADGTTEAATARATISDLTLQRNYRSLGSFCGSYCRILNLHHTIEDRALFPEIAAGQQSLAPVLQRLEWEHDVIAEVCTALDSTLVSLINGNSTIADVQEIVVTLDRVLHSHLDYEEQELVEPISRLHITV